MKNPLYGAECEEPEEVRRIRLRKQVEASAPGGREHQCATCYDKLTKGGRKDQILKNSYGEQIRAGDLTIVWKNVPDIDSKGEIRYLKS